MIHNPTVRKILGVLLAIGLSLLLVLEVKVGFNMLNNRIQAEISEFSQISKTAGHASVSIDEIYYYPEADYPSADGDVIALSDSKLRLQINGILTDNTAAQSGIYRYSQTDTERATTLYVEDKSREFNDYIEAYLAYLDGDEYALIERYGIVYQPNNITACEQSYKEFRVPILYNEGNSNYYGFVPDGDNKFWVITCEDPFILSTDKVTAHFGDPTKNPLRSHTYSDYEILASENTLRKILESILNGDSGEIQSPYQSDGVVGTSDTYTSTSDNNIRRQMVSYTDYDWDSTGQASGTNMKIDTTSSKAVASEWVLTATSYGYQNAGLQLLNMHGTKSSTFLEISGSIMNTLATDRPYVIVVKYVDSSRNLLGIDVLDNRSNALLGSSYHSFTSTVYSTEVDLDSVHAVQFEIY